jgi:ABC-type cobalamin/Fe3+-siderophores transport system ATPase subunit
VKKFIEEIKNPSFDNTQMTMRSRSLVVGASGTGKTNFLVNFIASSPMTFGRVIVVSKEIEEPLNQFVKDELKGSIVFFCLAQGFEMLVVFDDLVSDFKKGSEVENYFLAGRKCGLTQMFLTQSYYDVEKIIRRQLSYLIILRVSSENDLKMILRDCKSLGITIDELASIHDEATEDDLSFLKIDIKMRKREKKFSKGFTEFL